MTLNEVLKGVQCTRLAEGNPEITGIAIDSRGVRAGFLFICIKGLTADGHDFIESAVENGAAAIVCEREPEHVPEGIACLLVTDSRSASGQIAANFYGEPAKGLKLVGVTGTNGKTSITYFMEEVLNTAGKPCAVIGTTGIRFCGEQLDIAYDTSTTPDPIELHRTFKALAEAGAEYICMEVSSHALALRKLAGLEFEVGIFTNLTQDHLEFHGTMEAYAAAKAELFKLCRAGAINADDRWTEMIMPRGECRIVTYGMSAKSGMRAENVRLSGEGIAYDVVIDGETRHFTAPVPGRFTVYNTLAVITAASLLGVPIEEICRALACVSGVPGRVENIRNDLGFTVIVDYAHTPDGLQNILAAAREFTQGRLICVFGCGGSRDRTKRPQMGRIAGSLADFCVITSDNPRDEKPEDIIAEAKQGVTDTDCKYLAIANRREAIFKAISEANQGDCVVIAGKGHEDYQEFENKRRVHFDDREVAAEAVTAMQKRAD